jgi:hypothetical protein
MQRYLNLADCGKISTLPSGPIKYLLIIISNNKNTEDKSFLGKLS